jgi:DNA-binding winged helix-turn-helix (wHTH) protein
MQTGPVLRFDEFDLDIDAGELRHRGRKVRLAPQPFRLLVMLAGSEGRVVDLESIRRQLWDSTFVDFEHGVNFCVSEIRRALRDRAGCPKYIETLPRRGYRFLADVHAGGQNGAAPPPITDRRVGVADRLTEGRRLLRAMGVGTLDQARKIFEEALRLDPDCAMAHCGLGATRAMRFISRCEPGDLDLAKFHLERATALDPELAEPYPWLCYVYIRRGELEKSLEFGRRGVLLLPYLVHAHYFLGTVCFASCELGTRKYQEAIEHLLQASRIEPRWLATWFILSSLCLMHGDYERAEKFVQQLFQNETAEGPVLRFPGAENLMGMISLRRGDMPQAREWFSRSMAKLSTLDHTYGEAMKAWCACGLGDVDLRRGNPAAALAHYRLAWQIAQESPAILAQERHAARAQAGMAAAYAATGEEDHARHLLSQAESRLESSSRLQMSTAATNMAELRHAFAVTIVRMKDPQRAIAHLRNAFHSGWHDVAGLQRDPEMEPLQTEPAFLALLEEIRTSVPPLVFSDLVPE